MVKSRLEKLDRILQELQSFVVAFSGGVDSSLLLYRAHTLKNLKVIGVTIRTPYIPAVEIDEAVEFTKVHGIDHRIIDFPFPEDIRNNPVDRCYICKKTLFTKLALFASENLFNHVIDGTNADDIKDYRPGIRALEELNIRSPMLEAGLTKNDIRELAHGFGLKFWDKPAMACLLTRIPYNTQISTRVLSMVEKAEHFMLDQGYPGTRVRVHGDLARIECLPGNFEKLIHIPEKQIIIDYLKKLGFRYVSLDLEGYRTGSSNPGNIVL